MKVLLVALTMMACCSAIAQQESGSQYNTALGFKAAAGGGISFKKFLTSTNALEAQGMYFKDGVRFAALYEFHFFSFDGVPGLSWYVGPGAHFGFWGKTSRAAYNSTMDVGIDGVLGLDYKVPKLPLNLSLDWQPGFSVLGAGLQPQFGGLAIRYVIN